MWGHQLQSINTFGRVWANLKDWKGQLPVKQAIPPHTSYGDAQTL